MPPITSIKAAPGTQATQNQAAPGASDAAFAGVMAAMGITGQSTSVPTPTAGAPRSSAGGDSVSASIVGSPGTHSFSGSRTVVPDDGQNADHAPDETGDKRTTTTTAAGTGGASTGTGGASTGTSNASTGTSNASTGTAGTGTAGTGNAGTGHGQRRHGHGRQHRHEQRRHGGHEQRRHGRCRDECRRPNSQQRSRCPRAELRRADHGAVPRRWQRSGVAGNECAGFERSTKHSGLPRPGWCARGHGRGVAAGRRRSPWDLGRQACRRTGDNHQQPTACLRSRRGNRPRGQG